MKNEKKKTHTVTSRQCIRQECRKKARAHTHTHVDPCNATDILINYFHRKFP